MRSALVVSAAVVMSAVVVASQTAPQAPVTLEGYPALGTPSIIRLASPGAEPRQRLRYRLTAGQRSTLQLSTWMNMAMSMNGVESPATDVPVSRLFADLRVTDVAANGDITYELAFTDVVIEPLPGMSSDVVAAAQKSTDVIKSLKGRATVTDRGVNKSARFDFDGTDPAMKQAIAGASTSLESMSMPLPEEAVGVGARWEVRQTIDTSGTQMFQRAEYELVSADNGTFEFRVTLEQTAPPQRMSLDTLPAGATMKLQKLSGSGSGTMRLRLDTLVPTGEISVATHTAMLATVGGKSQPMTVDTKMKMAVAPVVR